MGMLFLTGTYIYVDARNKKPNGFASLLGKVDKHNGYCAQFWFNMYGKDVVTLAVYQVEKDGTKKQLFSQTGNNIH